MRKILEYFVERSLLVNVFTLLVMVIGGWSIFTLQKEIFPNVSFGYIAINTIYPGSSSEDVEKLVTIPVERKIRGVSGIKELNALSMEGRSMVIIEVDPSYDTDEVKESLRDAVALVDDLPDDAELPVIEKIESKNRPLIKVAVWGDDEMNLRRGIRDLRDFLENKIKELSDIEFTGVRDEIIDVAIDPDKAKRLELTVGEVTQAIAKRNINLSAGEIKSPRADFSVRTSEEFVDAGDVASVIVRSNINGKNVRVKDVALVAHILDDSDIENRADGKQAGFLRIIAHEKADVLGTTDKIKKYVAEYFKTRDQFKLSYSFSDDFSFFVKRRLNVLTKSGIQGMVLVFLCLLLFLNFRISLVTSLGAPLAFMAAFSLMDAMGITINLMSMFALIVVLGMLVDDAIIVSENCYRYLEQGWKPKDAAIQAARETVMPVTATVLTTIAAFGALYFIGGIMGKFMWVIPTIVILCLSASLLECFFILPSHLAELVKVKKEAVLEKKWFVAILKRYDKWLSFSMRFNYASLALFLLLLCVSVFVATRMRFELFPSSDVTEIQINFRGPVGTSFHETNEVIKEAETIALKELKREEYEMVRSLVGQQRRRGPSGSKQGPHYGSVILYLTMQYLRLRTNDEIMAAILPKIQDKIKNFEIVVEKQRHGPPRGKPIDVEISGDDLGQLKLAAKRVQEAITHLEGVTTSEIDFEEGRRQLVVRVDDYEASRLGLSVQDVALELRRSIQGDSVTEIRKSDEDLNIRVRFDKNARSQTDLLNTIFVYNNQGKRVSLARVAKIEERKGVFVIRRKDFKRAISASAEIDNLKTTSLRANKQMSELIEKISQDFPRLNFEMVGEQKDTEESFGYLRKAAIGALGFIFLILIAMFGRLSQSLVIMSAIPFGLIGVVFTFLVAGESLGFMALMGVVALIGVVVNDSIVLVSFINNKLGELKEKHESVEMFTVIVEGAKSRFRAVILTTFTTVVGLLPLAHDPNGDPFLRPMALAFAYGLLFASTITLFFIPNMLLRIEKIRVWVKSKF